MGKKPGWRPAPYRNGVVKKPILENRVVEITITGENYKYCKKNAERSCIDVASFLNIRVNSLLDKMSKI